MVEFVAKAFVEEVIHAQRKTKRRPGCNRAAVDPE
jgi:hypothetical protein